MPLIAQHTLMKCAALNSKIRTTLSFLLFSLFERANIIAEELSRGHFTIRIRVARTQVVKMGSFVDGRWGWDDQACHEGPSRVWTTVIRESFSYDRRSGEWWSRDKFYEERSRVLLKPSKWIFSSFKSPFLKLQTYSQARALWYRDTFARMNEGARGRINISSLPGSKPRAIIINQTACNY